MFGYIRVLPKQLSGADHADYRHIYCGLCHQLGKYSNCARFFLSFDMVFFMILSAYEDETLLAACQKGKCLRKCIADHKLLDYWAAVSVMMIYQKLLNDLSDGQKNRKIYVKALTSGYESARRSYSAVDETITKALTSIASLEREGTSDPNVLVDVFGSMLSDLMRQAPIQHHNDSWLDVQCNIAKMLGEWLYFLDFYDDVEKDQNKGQYNPFLLQAEKQGKTAEEIRQAYQSEVNKRVIELQRLCAFLPYNGYQRIVRNVLHEGVVDVTANVYQRTFQPSRR